MKYNSLQNSTRYYLILGSVVVRISACHAGDRGSIPRRGGILFFENCNYYLIKINGKLHDFWTLFPDFCHFWILKIPPNLLFYVNHFEILNFQILKIKFDILKYRKKYITHNTANNFNSLIIFILPFFSFKDPS